ncbi:RNI-like superfamily protein [Perilla frutescens var. hirtella]|uniref:RNI-like superfamily protein n=1 Tax=Perilla frutescens var. hirtella TaxID=608512 RepID=A0AAD4PG64_PERFH|nr:RNI-like superfamily protein [Perilla frutescens var. hirtella]
MEGGGACINDRLGDDELRAILAKLEDDKDKEVFGLACKRWLHLQSTERRKLCVRAGPHMLKRLAARFTRLRELDLSQSVSRSFYPGVTDSDLSVIAAAFSALRLLNLQNCKGITDKGMTSLASGLPSLHFLDVSYCRKLTDKGMSSIANGCHDLRALYVVGCRFVTDVLLSALSMNCNNLEELGLQGCTNITDSGLTVLVEGCKRLKQLDLNKCSNIGDIGISCISKECHSSLLTLKLLDCYKIGDDSILSLAKHCKRLETLIIGGCRQLSDESIKQLAFACCGSLKNLRMDWCLNVSDASLDCIFFLCRKLEVLDVGCCEEVTDAAFQRLGNEDSKLSLKILRVSNCPKITVDGMRKLLRSCEALEYIDVRSCPHVTEVRCHEAGLQFPVGCKVNFSGSLADPDVLC